MTYVGIFSAGLLGKKEMARLDVPGLDPWLGETQR